MSARAGDQLQDFGEQRQWNRHLGKLKSDVPTVPDHLRPSLASGLLADQDPAVQRRLLGLSEKPRFNRPVTN